MSNPNAMLLFYFILTGNTGLYEVPASFGSFIESS